MQTIVGVAVLLPLLIIGIVPLITGDVAMQAFQPFAPGTDPATAAWNKAGWTLFFGGLFIAAWSAYAFETAICYTSEFRNPGTDTYKAILYSGLLCIAVYILVPLSFQGALGLAGVMAPGIVDGSGVAQAMANMVGGGPFITNLLIVMLLLALMLAITTAMAGSSRTLYQGSVDGWPPRYLNHVNKNGAPTHGMWTDLTFNLILLLMSDYLFVLAVSNVCYIVFNFLNLNAGWIHRLDTLTSGVREGAGLAAGRRHCACLRQCVFARRRRRRLGEGNADVGHCRDCFDRPGLYLSSLHSG